MPHLMRLATPQSIVKVHRDHMPLIEEWYSARGRKPPKKGMLSSMGFIADNRVAGWLYLTDSNIAIVEGIIADPNTVPSLRRTSLRKLCGFLVDTALMLGYTEIVGMTEHPMIEDICKELGFSPTKLNVWVLSESEEE
jgi:hypothetical protein